MRFLTLRVRTFLFMMLNLLLAFLLTGAFSLFHFQEETTDYHLQRLERKNALSLVILNMSSPAKTVCREPMMSGLSCLTNG